MLKKVFDSYKYIEKFLKYGYDVAGSSEDMPNLRGEFIYYTLGYRKYMDSEFLNYFPDELLAKMIYGVILCSDDKR